MKMPGFTAEASIYRTPARYLLARTSSGGDGEALVVPAIYCEIDKDTGKGWCCTALNYCCLWRDGRSSPLCGYMNP